MCDPQSKNTEYTIDIKTHKQIMIKFIAILHLAKMMDDEYMTDVTK